MKPTMLYTGQADNSNWVVGHCHENRYYYFNTYPRLHSSPIANTKTKSTLNIGHINIRSLPKHYDELCLLPLQHFDVMCFSETWLTPHHSDNTIELTLFSDPFRHDRNDPHKLCGGGSAIYCKLGLHCTQLHHLESIFDKEIDSVWLKIKTEKKTIVIATIYKPPTANNTRLMESLEEVMLDNSISQCDIIITGDININWYNESPEKHQLASLMANFNMNQLIAGSTHVGLTNESCIDLIFTPSHMQIKSHGIIFNPMHNGITWHNFTYLSIGTTPKKIPRIIINKRNFKQFNEINFITDVARISNDIRLQTNATSNDLANNLETKIIGLVDQHAPFKRVRVRPTRKPWITPTLLKLITQKNSYFKHARNDAVQWTYYKEFRSYVQKKIHEAKKSYYANLINNATPNQKWDVINEITSNHKKPTQIKELHYNNEHFTDQAAIANTLNTYFSSIGTIINNELKETNPRIIESWKLNVNGFKLRLVETNEITDILKGLPNNKKGGIAQIPTFIYKMITPYIAEQLTELINEMIRNSTFPDIWKKALVTPLPKPGDPTNPSNYRPISSLPILSKIAEKIMSSQIRQYLESNSLISHKQYGFREKHSTQSLLLQLSNKWLETLDNITGDKYVWISRKLSTPLIMNYCFTKCVRILIFIDLSFN